MCVRINKVLETSLDDIGIRIDLFLHKNLNKFSRTQIQKWIKQGQVLVNNIVVKSNYSMQYSDKVSLDAQFSMSLPQWQPQENENFSKNIVYEDDDILVINKPANIIVYPAAGHHDGTLANFLLAYHQPLEKLPRAGMIHRIDKDTTGLLLCAKTESSFTDLVSKMSRREIKRTYWAIAHGLPNTTGTINAPIGRHLRDRKKMGVINSGKYAISHYKRIEAFVGNQISLMEVTLETGRTHQIRVHFKHIKFPLVGDTVYGKPKINKKVLGHETAEILESFTRQALHAKKLQLIHPNGTKINIEAPLPDDFTSLIHKLRLNS